MTGGDTAVVGPDLEPGRLAEPADALSLGAISGCFPPQLRAGKATLVVLAYLAAQIATGFAAGVVAVTLASLAGRNPNDPQVVAEASRAAMAPALVIGMLLSGLLMLGLGHTWFRSQLADPGPNGAAWRLGRLGHLGAGAATGALLGLVYLGWALLLGGAQDVETVGPITRMALTPGGQRLAWMIVAVLLAPPIEELLFRGVLYGGFRRSFGATWAALVTTLVFVLLHLSEVIHFLPAAFSLAVLALAALALRLRGSAIGPAVAAHAGYNAVLVVFAVMATG